LIVKLNRLQESSKLDIKTIFIFSYLLLNLNNNKI